ncbi:mechanosensitive ion channel family protein [Shewanella chilikensis]|uniref:mechanosensitive ion channel family protein n=1 Tax=Shewanella chilikensis TaxID=558541 RepID=UPI001F3D5CED|nr:mechanosensitive ion channel family protein [Shewanella chilikensis]MCE9787649.1 mechanosensitive ion channel [Shewanella chilikensis]
MVRSLLLVLCLSLSWQSFASEPEPLATEQFTLMQQTIRQNIQQLRTAKGELKAVTEFRIKALTLAQRNKLKESIDTIDDKSAEQNAKVNVLPHLQAQRQLLMEIVQYLDKEIMSLQGKLGKGEDQQLMLEISRRSLEKDEIQKGLLELLNWSEQLGQDVSQAKESLKQRLIVRAELLESLVSYNQQQLGVQMAENALAGKDVSSEQSKTLTLLKERLENNSSSLSAVIGMLDKLDVDTSDLKKTLFAISGDITQDVLNIDIVSSLAGQWFDIAKAQLIEGGPDILFKIFIFLFILLLTVLLAKLTKRIVAKAVSNSKLKFSKLLQDFFISLSGKIIFTLGLLIALSQLGFELGPLLAGFGIAGVIIGFALQDTLSNFASGMMILIYRPFDVGDLIHAAGVTGRVSHMSLVSTTIKTLDNQRLIIPNNKIWGDTINNITAEHHRRVDMTFGISYSDNIEQTEAVLEQLVQEHPKVLKHPEPTVKLHLLGESSVDFVVRPWVRPEDYWEVYWDITRAVKMRFDEEGISIPFPQRDVHFYRG